MRFGLLVTNQHLPSTPVVERFAVERAAKLGDAWVINPHATLHTIRRQMGLYRAALERLDKPFPAELPMMRGECSQVDR